METAASPRASERHEHRERTDAPSSWPSVRDTIGTPAHARFLTGRKTGAYRQPVSYVIDGERLLTVKQAERDAGTRSDGLTSGERAELAQLRRENRRLREDVDILKRGGCRTNASAA